MNALIVNNDLTKSANLNELKDTAHQWLSPPGAANGFKGTLQQDEEDFIYNYEFKIGECAHRLVIRDIGTKHLTRSETISHIKEKILAQDPGLVYLHFASYGHANHFKDYITVQVADQLKSAKSTIQVVFFTSGPVDNSRFNAETGYSIFTQTCAGDVLNHVFEDMGIKVPLNNRRTSV